MGSQEPGTRCPPWGRPHHVPPQHHGHGSSSHSPTLLVALCPDHIPKCPTTGTARQVGTSLRWVRMGALTPWYHLGCAGLPLHRSIPFGVLAASRTLPHQTASQGEGWGENGMSRQSQVTTGASKLLPRGLCHGSQPVQTSPFAGRCFEGPKPRSSLPSHLGPPRCWLHLAMPRKPCPGSG